MSCYRKLKLPANPCRDWLGLTSTIIIPYGFKELYEPEKVLTDEVLDIFHNAGIELDYIVIFSSFGVSKAAEEKRKIHSDITFNKDTQRWEPVYCGINWELDGTNLFSWWDMSEVESFLPPDTVEWTNRLNGRHYFKRNFLGIPPGAKRIEQAYIDGPTLVRTDIAHLTAFNTPKTRYGLSVRIKEHNIHSWEDAVNLFQPLIAE